MTADAIQAAYTKFIEKEERKSDPRERRWVYASQWSACTRQIALDLLYPEARKQYSADTLANFRRGNDRARDIKSDMTRVGRECDPPFDVVGAEERFELRDKKGRVCIVGKVDFRLKFDGRKGSMPVETKSYHPNLTQGVEVFEDMFRNRWLRKGSHQLLAYLLATNEPAGFMLLDRPGIPKLLEVSLYDHLDKAEDFLQRAEIALDAKEAITKEKSDDSIPFATLPPYIDDPSECRVCDFFGSLCNPPLSYAGAAIYTDEETIIKTERFAELDAMPEIDEHEALNNWKKEKFRGVENAIVGKCVVTGKPRKTTKLVFPDDATKKKYEVSDPNGGWITTITKVTE